MVRAALVTPLSGPLAEYGRAGAIALELWAASAGATLTVHDAHPDPAGATRAAERERPDLLFGPYGSSPTSAVAAATSRLAFNHGGARVGEAANVVSVLAPADTYFEGAIQAVHAADPELRSVCVVSADTGFARAVASGAVREAERLGLEVVRGTVHFPPSEVGSATSHFPPADLLLVVGSFADELAAARRLLPGRWRAAGFVGAGVDEVLAELGERRAGLLGPAQWLAEAAPEPDEGPTAAEFVAEYRARTGADPPYPAAQAYAAGLIAHRCLRDAGTADDAALQAAARALDCTTLFARFRLDPDTGAQVGHRVLTVQWQDGRRRVVWPPERALAPLRHPL